MALTACATCAHPVPSGARFCPSCGSPVDVASGTSLEERRVVTVLFADLVGYTALAEHRDPENVKHFIESCFERLVADIETFGGRVDKLLGDAIVALFGAPVAHEDDAERAVRAGLRMQETLARFASERRAVEEGPPIEMRVGINTGEVLVGTLAGTEYTAMGDVVNTASRLQSIAPPGRVLIGSATAALCSGAIDREPFGVTQIRGRDQMEQSWLVTGAAAAGTRPSRDDVPFVGRACERTLLDAAVELVRMGHSGVVSIVGEAGAGKTRLAEEIVGPLEGEAIVVRTACAPYGESGVWAPVITGITSMFGVDPDSGVDDIRAAVQAKAHDIWGLEADDAEVQRFLDVITHLLGHPSELDRLDAAGARDVIAAAVTDMMRHHAQTRMTVLWIDNLQWADPVIRDQLGGRGPDAGRVALPLGDRPTTRPRRRVAPARRPPARAAGPARSARPGRRRGAGPPRRRPRRAARPSSTTGRSTSSSTAGAATRCSWSSWPASRPPARPAPSCRAPCAP